MDRTNENKEKVEQAAATFATKFAPIMAERFSEPANEVLAKKAMLNLTGLYVYEQFKGRDPRDAMITIFNCVSDLFNGIELSKNG